MSREKQVALIVEMCKVASRKSSLLLGGLKTHPIVIKDQLFSLWVLFRTCRGESVRKPGAPWLSWTKGSTRSPGGAWTTRSFRPAWILRPLFMFSLRGGR